MFAGNITVDSNTRGSHRVVTTDGDLPLEGPGLSIERPAHHLEDVHDRTAFARGGRAVLSERKHSMNRDEILEMARESEALRAAEFMQAQELLNGMIGHRIVAARLEETRIAIETDDGAIFYFYGFMGEDSPGEESAGS